MQILIGIVDAQADLSLCVWHMLKDPLSRDAAQMFVPPIS